MTDYLDSIRKIDINKHNTEIDYASVGKSNNNFEIVAFGIDNDDSIVTGLRCKSCGNIKLYRQNKRMIQNVSCDTCKKKSIIYLKVSRTWDKYYIGIEILSGYGYNKIRATKKKRKSNKIKKDN